ncbi:Para-nitrobenzyl esterase [Pseudocercospora fuligena]|uniref:Para-nitrobenzyl esterase n=1 Tax=Pseudocercospora fuligena TaxID=685502 RepID=A0A8H6RPF9_9PEZI|nr:Para-nitrobenzyl esterase [Pseudocercospora fuligena]
MLRCRLVALLSCLICTTLGSPTGARDEPGCSNSESSLTLLYQNNLNASDDINHRGAILLDPLDVTQAASACSMIGESLIGRKQLQNYNQDYYHLLAYSDRLKSQKRYLIQDGTVQIGQSGAELQFSASTSKEGSLPVLCTQSSLQNGPNANGTTNGQISLLSGGNTYIGFRNQKSFRFQGIPYADSPKRFQYSTVYSAKGKTINATSYGADCTQASDSESSEDCLFLNIQTPYIPRAGSKAGLRPVLFSIHGGGFVNGNGKGTSGQDGGNFASREDIVSVEINYRLSTLGFLAIPGTEVKGNFGIGDQITALRWVRENIAQFGGDPNKVTIIGESAGAGSVRTLLGSPIVIKDKLIAGAVAQSNLGGGVTLGLDGNYGTTYSSYLTVNQSYTRAGEQILAETGCNQTDVQAQISCLKLVPACKLVELQTTAQYVVQDGTIVNTEQLIVSRNNGSTAQVPVIFGTTRNDGASIGSSYPQSNITSISEGIQQSLSISAHYAQAIIDCGLFPRYDTGNLTLDAFNISQRVATDITFRCVDEATIYAASKSWAFPKAYYYEMERIYQGYDPNNLGELSQGTISAQYPYGDPDSPYFRLHGSDLGFTYGNQDPLRDDTDLLASQLISGYFAQFVKTGDPSPDLGYLRLRGYYDQLKSAQQSGGWQPFESQSGPVKALDYPSRTINFPEVEQCKFLNYSLSYYLEGGS